MPPSTNDKTPRLLLAPAISVWRYQGERYFDRKFFDGLHAYLDHWPGHVRLAMFGKNISETAAFGMVAFSELPSRVEFVDLEEGKALQKADLRGVDCVLASADNYRLSKTHEICTELGIPLVHDVEYTFRTRMDFLRAEKKPWYRSLRSWIWLWRQEKKMRIALSRANAIQANGWPAFNDYSQKDRNDLVYLDSRITREVMVGEFDLERRLVGLADGAPLRLAFSGRLISAKGADALIALAIELRSLGVPFQMDIFGAGALSDGMSLEIAKSKLDEQVRMHGAVDFRTALMPHIRDKVDIFVCCHRQGDPSCTYIETYGCGVPIAGFANEAHQALLANADVGWQVPVDDVRGLAALIRRLDTQRDEIAAKSRRALALAEEHMFDVTFARRMSHCLRVAKCAE